MVRRPPQRREEEGESVKTRRKKKADPAAQTALSDFLDPPDKPKKPRSSSSEKGKRALRLAMQNAKIRASEGDWDDANPRDFVGLFAVCHSLVYGVEPLELQEQTELKKATRIARKCLENHFADDHAEFVEFIKWAWKRQEGKIAWAHRNGREISRLNIYIQFSTGFVTDFRASALRGGKR